MVVAGADNYLVKPVEQAKLWLCVQSLARRLKPTAQSEQADLALDTQILSLKGPITGVAVTYSEKSLLLCAMSRAVGQKLERWQAMQLIDTKDKGLWPANLEMRISSLRKKISACGVSADAIHTIRGFGYALTCCVTIV